MADSSHAPGGYYTGPPAAPHDKKQKAPPSEPEPEPEPVDGQVNVPGYYNGGPAAKAGGGHGSSAAPKEPGFFASCCPCFSGGAAAK